MQLDPRLFEPLSMALMRFLHQSLKIVILVTLDCSQEAEPKLRIEKGRLQDVADQIQARVEAS